MWMASGGFVQGIQCNNWITRHPVATVTVTSAPVTRLFSLPFTPWLGMLRHLIVAGRHVPEAEHLVHRVMLPRVPGACGSRPPGVQ